jgi:LacI family transcriptional regulator
LGVPVIVASHMTLEPTLPCIMTDCEAIGKVAARHFLERGFRHFGYCGLEEMFWSGRRAASFTTVIREAGYTVHQYRQPQAKRDRLWGQEQFIMAKWLEQLPKPAGIMACTDDRARDLVEACEIAGLNVPEDAAILGVDNDRLVCDLAGVPISSVALNTEQAGFEAAELLAQLMAGKNVRQQRIIVSATHVEVRRSTDILAIADRFVAKAVHFINTRANEPLQVSEVAREVALSERHLYDRFQRALGRSIHEQISMTRIARICWLLENTNLSVLDIALAMGMPDDKHLSRYFRRQQGIPPSKWRKQHHR